MNPMRLLIGLFNQIVKSSAKIRRLDDVMYELALTVGGGVGGRLYFVLHHVLLLLFLSSSIKWVFLFSVVV